jgi:hypothetical protein
MNPDDRAPDSGGDKRQRRAARLRQLGELHVAEQLERIATLLDVSRTARQVLDAGDADRLLDQASRILAELLGPDPPAWGNS